MTASQLLNVWEQGQHQPPVDRALALLAAACPETSPADLARLSIGRRDARLLTLREWMFGPRLDCVLGCPGCDEPLELALRVDDLRAPAPAAADGDGMPIVHEVDAAGYRLTFRLPDSLDVAAVAGSPDVAGARQRLLERCLVLVRPSKASRGPRIPGRSGKAETDQGSDITSATSPALVPVGAATTAAELPDAAIEALLARMAELDPLAEMSLALNCPACGHAWEALFDIVAFFWQEIQAWAWRVLREVHILAAAYGWSEADILAMSPLRRQAYLDLVEGWADG